MRRAAVLLALLLCAPALVASGSGAREAGAPYVAGDGEARVVGPVGVGGAPFYPLEGESVVSVEALDATGLAVPIAVCDEWMFDDGSHPVRSCTAVACGSVVVALAPQPRPEARWHRVVAFVFDDAGACPMRGTAGELVATFN